MQLGMIGLGRMGANIVRRLMRDGHTCVVYDVSAEAVARLAAEGATGSTSLDDFVARLDTPRHAWVMVPAGDITESTVRELGARLEPGDTVVDGGNSYYRDDIRRAAELAERGIRYVDFGTSGGVFGLERGFCLMVGGPGRGVRGARAHLRLARSRNRRSDEDSGARGRAVGGGAGLPVLRAARRRPLREDGAQRDRVRDDGGARGGAEHPPLGRRGPAAARQRRRDGAARPSGELLVRARPPARSRSCGGAAASSSRGSSTSPLRHCRSRRQLEGFEGRVSDSGEGRWTAIAAIEEGVPADVLTAALFARFASRGEGFYANKAALGDAKPVRRASREAGVVARRRPST